MLQDMETESDDMDVQQLPSASLQQQQQQQQQQLQPLFSRPTCTEASKAL